jgi:hypothetical protein
VPWLRPCLRHTSAVGIPASCSLMTPMIWASLKRLFCICLLLKKVKQKLHQNEGSFEGQVIDIVISGHSRSFSVISNTPTDIFQVPLCVASRTVCTVRGQKHPKGGRILDKINANVRTSDRLCHNIHAASSTRRQPGKGSDRSSGRTSGLGATTAGTRQPSSNDFKAGQSMSAPIKTSSCRRSPQGSDQCSLI